MHFYKHTITRSQRHSRRAWFVLLALAAMIVLAACGGSTSGGSTPTPAQTGNTPTTAPAGNTPTATATPSGPTKAVTIDTPGGTFGFTPDTITIKVGTTVVWTNKTGAPHTVTSDDGKTFDSGINTPIAAGGGTFSFTFTKAGTYSYHCQIHPFMTAMVVVQA